MFSTLVLVSAPHPSHVRLKTPSEMLAGLQLSKKLAGKDVREEQLYHAYLKFVPDEVLIAGKDVRELQLYHATEKSVPDEVLIAGKDVREEQLYHA